MHIADEFDDLDDDDLLSAAVHCGNGDTKNTLNLSPRPNKRRRVHQDTVKTSSSLIKGQSTLATTQNGIGSHSAVTARDGVQNGANGNVYNNAAWRTRVTSTARAVGDTNGGKGHSRNDFGTRNSGKPISSNSNVVTM